MLLSSLYVKRISPKQATLTSRPTTKGPMLLSSLYAKLSKGAKRSFLRRIYPLGWSPCRLALWSLWSPACHLMRCTERQMNHLHGSAKWREMWEPHQEQDMSCPCLRHTISKAFVPSLLMARWRDYPMLYYEELRKDAVLQLVLLRLNLLLLFNY